MGILTTARVSLIALFFCVVLSLPLAQPKKPQETKRSSFHALQRMGLNELFNKTNQSSHDQLEKVMVVREMDNSVALSGFMTKDTTLDESVDNGTNINAERAEQLSGDREPSASAPGQESGKVPLRFFTEIDDKKVYGGLITYSHAFHPARICRVMNACVRPDGTLVLPEWMKRYDTTISFHCGHSKLEFSLEDSFPPQPLDPYELVGIHTSRPSMPDFIKDFMSNAIVFDLVYGDHHVTKSCHSRKGTDCNIFPTLTQDFRPAVYLHSRIEDMDDRVSWVRQFVRLMKPPDSGKHAKITYIEDDNENQEGMQCYRSTLFTRGPYNKNFVAKDHLQNMHFLHLHEIEKKARDLVAEAKDRNHHCSINVTISNRKLVDGARSRLVGRYILNIPQLRKALSRQARRIPRLQLKVSTMTLESRSLRWHMNAMQKTDIWIAGHGPLLTNMIFMRENSTMMEIQPFGYYPQEYEKMAKHLAHVSYDRYIAHPDEEGFKACMMHFYPEDHRSHNDALALLAKFSAAAAKYAQSDSTHSFVLTHYRDANLRHVKTCALMQRIDTNAGNLATAVVRHARLLCGLPKPSARTNSKLRKKTLRTRSRAINS